MSFARSKLTNVRLEKLGISLKYHSLVHEKDKIYFNN